MIAARAWQNNRRLLWLGQFLTTAGLTVVVPFLPLHMEHLGVSDPAMIQLWSGLALAAPAISLSICAPLWGRVGDRWGRKWMVVRALLGLAISLVLMGLSTTPLLFLLCRLIQGLCGGLSDAIAGFVSAEAPADMRGKTLGCMQSATAAGCLAGPLLAGPLIDVWGLRPLLLVAGLLTGLTGLVATRLLREETRRGATTRSQETLRQAMAGLLHQRQAKAFLLAGLCTQAGTYGLVTVFAPHVRSLLPEADGVATWVGLLQAAAWAASAAGAIWWGRRNDRAPLEHNFTLAALACGLSIALQGLTLSAWLLLPLRLLQGFCLSAFAQSIYLAVNRAAASGREGLHAGFANSFLTFGQVAGALSAATLGSLLSAPQMFLLMSVLFGFAALLVQQSAKRQLRFEGDTAAR